jgi:DNA-binding response OmpR family regulator
VIIVASANIFRRELTSYLLADAGYSVREARSLAELSALLALDSPRALVVDTQLDGAQPLALALLVRELSEAPILWMADPDTLGPRLDAPSPHELTAWPFRSNQFLERLATLLQQAEQLRTHERSVGGCC